jgi:hypothetical protein
MIYTTASTIRMIISEGKVKTLQFTQRITRSLGVAGISA